MQFVLRATRLGLRNSTTRLPFRYGKACLTRCPQAILEAQIEVGGRRTAGYSGDCLPPAWFDKSPGKSYAQQIADMLASIAQAEAIFLEQAARPIEFFPAWHAAYAEVRQNAATAGFNPLLASFGLSMVERAVMDALARAASMSFAQAVRANLYAIQPGLVHARLQDLQPADWLPSEPRRELFVRHTVGLGDPLTPADIRPEDRLHDGFPQALEEYVLRSGIRWFKVKISGDVESDSQRLRAIAEVLGRLRGSDYRLTLDANEQFQDVGQLLSLVDMLRGLPQLAVLLENIVAIEQPLARDGAMDERNARGLRELARWRPVIIDESDESVDSYARALEIGYRGTSSKNCKGPVKSLLNAGLTWLANDRGRRSDYLMTGEDLCSVGIVPVQADLALVATLGLSHVERNGHHYHAGLSYLPESQQRAALAAHGDFYAAENGRVVPRVVDGQFVIGSLQCAGFGFAVLPDIDAMEPPATWQFASLGLP